MGALTFTHQDWRQVSGFLSFGFSVHISYTQQWCTFLSSVKVNHSSKIIMIV